MDRIAIVVYGPPATGKTWLAQRLSQYLRLPLFYKDMIKESLFESLGWSDREWSKKLGVASIRLLYLLLDGQLAADRSCIVESNFRREWDAEQLEALVARYGYRCLEIQCVTEPEVLKERFQARAKSGERHPGHCDAGNLNEFDNVLSERNPEPLGISDEFLVWDTTDLDALEIDDLVRKIELVANRSYQANRFGAPIRSMHG